MFTPFGDERKRKINLGGVSSVVSNTTLLGQARALRTERLEQQRRHENASKVQAWWRGTQEARRVRRQMRRMFEQDVCGVDGLRCLVIIGRKDEEALATWSSAMAAGGSDTLFALPRQKETHDSWLVLIRQAAILLLRSVANSSTNSRSLPHLKVLNALLSPTTTTAALGAVGRDVSSQIMMYLLHRDLFSLLSRSISSIPLSARASPILSHLVTLATLPFSALPVETQQYIASLNAIFTLILTIPLLPNRIPSAALIDLSARIPFYYLASLDANHVIEATTPDDKLNLVANLQVFVAPRYKLLDAKAHKVYFTLLSRLLNLLPLHVLNPPSPKSSSSTTASTAQYDSDSDTDSPRTRVTLVSSFSSSNSSLLPITPPDARTLKRLSALSSVSHLSTLLSLPSSPTSRPALLQLLFAISTIWPADVAPRILAAAPSLVREIYRGYVRGSPIGRDSSVSALGGEASTAEIWVPFLLLVEIYTKAMVTMGDDEFFGTNSGASSGGRVLGSVGAGGVVQVARNPLSLDELVGWSRQLMNVAFALYWRDDREALVKMVGLEGGGSVRCTWEGVREKVTKCLAGIHARDSRKPFVPAGHWLVTSQIDVQSFVEAAIFEERELSNVTPDSPVLPIPRNQGYSQRHLTHLSPRLGVLNNIPFTIPFDIRVSIFRHFALNDAVARASSRDNRDHFFYGNGRHRVQIRRGSVAQDGFDRLAEADLKAPMEIVFIDQFGAEEAGIDGGGVFKEFFTSLCKEVFDTDRGLWLANKKNELYPNPHNYATESHSLNWYRFIGRILGKAMYDGILVDVAFAGFFLAKWLGRQSFLDDLASLDPDLYNGLIFLKHYTGNLEDLALNFTVAVDELGVTKSVDLIPNGSNVAVTKENRLQYIQLISHYRLTKQIKLQSEAFFEGLSEMIDPRWIRMFNQQEIQILLGGVNKPIDFDDLRRHTNYGGLYDDNELTIIMFWNVVNTFDQEQRMALLRFVTSCSRPPLL
ncbi:hypothetical protein C0995_008128 [Termitomyces sp. Mi166|nr:hypothetical protein C0995_008128 [Termitomyces sp. Mi166\